MSTENKNIFDERDNLRDVTTFDSEPACPKAEIPAPEPVPEPDVLDKDLPCTEAFVGGVPEDNQQFKQSDKQDVKLQTAQGTGTNPERPWSLGNMADQSAMKSHVFPCINDAKEVHIPCKKIVGDAINSRNPILGSGLNGDGVGGLRPKKLKLREGNPVTGEGYKAGATDYNQSSATNNGTPVVNKNRIPPGGYSSGLW